MTDRDQRIATRAIEVAQRIRLQLAETMAPQDSHFEPTYRAAVAVYNALATAQAMYDTGPV